MELSVKNLREVTLQVLPTDEEAEAMNLSPETALDVPIEGLTMVQGTMYTFGFITSRLEEQRENIVSMLRQLPKEFMKEGGGGMSMLNMPFDKDGKQWGEQINADNLYVLGAGLGLCSFCLPRNMWSSLPGSMPYIVVDLPAETTNV